MAEQQIEQVQYVVSDILTRIKDAQDSPIGLYSMLFTDERGRPVIIKKFHYEWAELCMKHRLFVVCASREATKTSFMLAAVAWLVGRNPNIRVKWLSDDEDTAMKRLAVLHSIIDSDIYRWIFPNTRKLTAQESKEEKRPNSAGTLNVKRDFRTPEPTIEACGILTAGTGGRSDLICADDVVSETNALLNPSLKPKVISKFLSDWLGTLVADGRVWYIGSPWHRDDLLGYLKNKSGWIYREYHHGKPNDPYFSIFPERWPREALMERRRTLGPMHYARAYLCQPFQEGTVAVKPESLRPYTEEQLTQEKVLNAQVIICLDPSSGKQLQKGKLDYTGVTIFLFVQHPVTENPPFEIFVAEAYQIMLPHVFQAKLVWQLAQQWNAQHVLVESAGMQSLHMWLEEQRNLDPTLPMIDIQPVAPGNQNKGQRLIRITPLLERPEKDQPVVYFHPQLLEDNPTPFYIDVGGTPFEALRDLKGQLVGFPTEHDDILDSFTHGMFWIHDSLVDHTSVQDSEYQDDNMRGSFTCIQL